MRRHAYHSVEKAGTLLIPKSSLIEGSTNFTNRRYDLSATQKSTPKTIAVWTSNLSFLVLLQLVFKSIKRKNLYVVRTRFLRFTEYVLIRGTLHHLFGTANTKEGRDAPISNLSYRTLNRAVDQQHLNRNRGKRLIRIDEKKFIL